MVEETYRDALDPLPRQSFGPAAGRIASDAPQIEFLRGLSISKHGFDDTAALIASCSKDDEDLLGCHGRCRLWECRV